MEFLAMTEPMELPFGNKVDDIIAVDLDSDVSPQFSSKPLRFDIAILTGFEPYRK
jgi:hypothetical protein